MKRRIALLAATAMALPLAAQAQPVTGLYIGAGAGINFKHDFDGSALGFTARLQQRQPGVAVAGSVGYGFGNGLHAEAEFSWRSQGTRAVSLSGFKIPGGGGRTETLGPMFNALYDFNGISPFMVPYVGVGVGAQWRMPHNLGAFGVVTNDDDMNFAYQGIAGAAFPISSVPGLSLTAEYRFMGVLPTRHNLNIPGVRAKLSDDHNHSILLGARYEFNKAPMAVVAQQAALPIAPSRSFLVFFDWDKFNLSDRARAVIRDAAAASKSVQHTTVEVNGYADTSGSPRYNMPLSMKRAQTVAAELVRNGVARNEIAIKAFGDTVLLVQTGPGVREPQNRRVEIIIR